MTFLTALFAFGTAVYTAFLFGQAKGRDLWQSSLLGPHLALQALTAGAALTAPRALLWLLPLDALLICAEVYGRHPTADGKRAAQLIAAGPWLLQGVLGLGHLVPFCLLVLELRTSSGVGPGSFTGLAAGFALGGLLLWEHLFVWAPQQVPNA
jgi:formate-dependent nitrite reductase membrane component NrfD